jgi:alcohol dehydrogenase (cytochrome c)
VKIEKRVRVWGLLAVISISMAAVFYGTSLLRARSISIRDVPSMVTWRARLYVRKATGRVPELSWSELWQMSLHRGGFNLDTTVQSDISLSGGLVNSYDTPADNEAGSRIFRQKCAMCHGDAGTGLEGPPLNRAGLTHGDSDLAVYQVIRDGIPGTAMSAVPLSLPDRWQVVGYVRSLARSAEHGSDKQPLHIQVSSEQIRAAGTRTDEWLTYSGSLDGRRYTPLAEINAANVAQLRIRWIRQFDINEKTFQATPLVAGGVMFTTIPPSNVVALDVRTGNEIWRYERTIPDDLPLCCGLVNRGLAILGSAVFVGSLDGHLIAINAATGQELWKTEVADPAKGYTLTGAPLIMNQSVVVGVAGGEFGIRGFLAAYDAATGKEQWRFNTIPGPGERGHETWKNDAWETGGGPTWTTGSYDPALQLLYWGVGNPAPPFGGDDRPGDNLYTNSVIALHASSGRLAWYFQFTPHDEHDWDSTQTPILADVPINGTMRKVICFVNRNGFYYVLDRTTGEFLTGVAFVEQNWAEGLDAKGRPILAKMNEVTYGGRLIKPAVGGGTNWHNAALDAGRGLIFVHALEGASVYTKSRDVRRGERDSFLGSTASYTGTSTPTLVVRALDVATGARKWEQSPAHKVDALGRSGLLATGGGLVFGAAGGFAFALDSTTGRELWRVSVGGRTVASPISFTVDGQQVVALSAGRTMFVFALPPQKTDSRPEG